MSKMIEISDSTYKKLQAALILSEEDEADVMDKLVRAYAKKVFADEAAESETTKHRWTFEEDFIVCKNFIDKYVIQKSAAGIQTVVSKVKEELPEINEGSVRMKMQNISALCSKYQVAATAKIKNLGQYSTQLEKAFKAAMAELKVKPEDLEKDTEVAENIDAIAEELAEDIGTAVDELAEEAEAIERSVEEELDALDDELDEELEKLEGILEEEEKKEGPSTRQKVAESAEKFIKSAEPVVKNVMGTAVNGLAKAAGVMAAGLAKVAESANKTAAETAETVETVVEEAAEAAADVAEEVAEAAEETAEETAEAVEEAVEEVKEEVTETTEE